jgi:CubicO group peptidase (beta-lactamase class C family)
MRSRLGSFILLTLLLLSLGQPASAQPATHAATSPAVQAVIDKYRKLIPEEMKKQNIPGMAVTLVDDGQVLWSEGFGYTDWDHKTPVTADTPFSIQSMSKSFTAAAVLMGVQDGLLDLDTPISQYLPDFHLNSIFEERPEEKITLRHLLSHTAGFTHDAPVGNNNDIQPGTWKEHIYSIADTWLLFPVGTRYGYSNDGIDLAAYILEVRAGMPFPQYVKTRLLDPLGMTHSTFDINTIRAMPDRAIGHSLFFRQAPLVTMMPSGGVYSTSNDLARYLLFYLNLGKAGEQQLLTPELMKAMYEGQFSATARAGYGMGLTFSHDKTGMLRVNHNGGGFGFLSQMTWYPEMKFGVAWVSNTSDHSLQSWLGDQILADYFLANQVVLVKRASQSGAFPQKSFGAGDPSSLSDSALAAMIQAKGVSSSPEALARWQTYTGMYGLRTWGRILQLFDVRLQNDRLTMNSLPLTEVRPGLLISSDGEALDLRGPVMRLKGYRVEKINPALWLFYRIFLYVCGLACLALLLWPLVAWILRLVRHRAPAEHPTWISRTTGGLVWLAALVGLVLFGGLQQYPFMVLNGIPLPTPNLPRIQKGFLYSPYLVLALALTAAACLVIGWKGRTGRARWMDAGKVVILVIYAVVAI